MSACSFSKLLASNPPPSLDPCVRGCNLQPYSLTDATNKIGVLPYDGVGATSPDRDRFKSWWQALVRRNGVRIKYWRYGYDFTNQDFLYGEAPTAPFEDDRLLAGAANLTNNAVTMQRFGFSASSDINVIIPIQEFVRVYGADARPHSDDLFTIVDAYTDRPNNFGPRIFQVTYADDEGPDTNQLGGHYVWTLEAVRWQGSHQPNAPTENKESSATEATEDAFVGVLAGGSSPQSLPRPYTDTADQMAQNDFDQTQAGERDAVYGGY